MKFPERCRVARKVEKRNGRTWSIHPPFTAGVRPNQAMREVRGVLETRMESAGTGADVMDDMGGGAE